MCSRQFPCWVIVYLVLSRCFKLPMRWPSHSFELSLFLRFWVFHNSARLVKVSRDFLSAWPNHRHFCLSTGFPWVGLWIDKCMATEHQGLIASKQFKSFIVPINSTPFVYCYLLFLSKEFSLGNNYQRRKHLETCLEYSLLCRVRNSCVIFNLLYSSGLHVSKWNICVRV